MENLINQYSIEECRVIINKIWEEYDRLKEENHALKQTLQKLQEHNEELYKLP